MHWKLSAVMGWTVVGVVLLTGAKGDGELRTDRLVIEDSKGHERLILQVANGDPSITMNDAGGVERLVIELDRNGDPSIYLNGLDGKPRYEAWIGDDTKARLIVNGTHLDHVDPNADRP